MPTSRWHRLPTVLFSAIVILFGFFVLATGLWNWQSDDPARGYCYLLLALIASGLKLSLPQIAGTLSVNFVFILIGIMELTFSETLLMGCAATAVQVLIHKQGRRVEMQALFHIAHTAIAIAVCYQIYYSDYIRAQNLNIALGLVLAASVLYAMNTFPVAVMIALSKGRRLGSVWRACNIWAFPYYLAGACLAALFDFSNRLLGGQSPILLLPVAFLIYCSYHSYLGRLSAQKSHVGATAALHLRTIEALALAIEAKELTAHNHLRRLQLYCVELGKELKVGTGELEALRAAAVLHDIGKLAVPEHILSKPGRLTREEFEKVKIHPSVGAEILERVHFPYPVARIVRCHHEKWNGGGYPLGLKGEAIPIGARILAVVDALDALVSDRPYRVALSLEEAMVRIAAESGVSFDPKVVRVLQRRYQELEAILQAHSLQPEAAACERDVAAEMIEPGSAAREPAPCSGHGDSRKPGYLVTIAAARQEAQALLELTHELGSSLHLDDTFAALSSGLKRLVPFDTLVIYVLRQDTLIPRYASGENAALFLSGQVRLGHGLAGWAVQHQKPILNGNPSVELGAVYDGNRSESLKTGLSVPLPGMQVPVGALLLCRGRAGTFSKDHLRLLLAVSPKLGMVMENALKYEQASVSATTDFLTGLPNSRALQLQLESELARARRIDSSLTVLVSDLDGFKQVNDRFGHLEGNAVLCAVARALRDACREYDYVARMGGDEFVALLPGLPIEDQERKTARLNRTVFDAARKVCPDAELSLSVGLARFPDDGADAESLLAAADQRMYQAKQERKRKLHGDTPRGFDFDWLETTPS